MNRKQNISLNLLECENIRYQYDNHLGSACLELDASASIISYEEYHPFGTSSYRLGINEAEVQLKRYRYVGKERDEETGLYYYGARYYAAWLGRFVSVDPLSDKYPSLSPYAYCANNPVVLVDPNGMEIDDYFTKDGKYLGSDNAKTDYIRIISQQDWDANKKTGLSKSNRFTRTKTTISHKGGNAKSVSINEMSLSNQALNSIVGHYDTRLDSKSTVSGVNISAANLGPSVIMRSQSGGGFYLFGLEIVSPSNDILFDNQGNGYIDPVLNTASNISNALTHEYQHQKDRHQPMSEKTKELRAIGVQKNHSSYENTTTEFKKVIEIYENYYNNK